MDIQEVKAVEGPDYTQTQQHLLGQLANWKAETKIINLEKTLAKWPSLL